MITPALLTRMSAPPNSFSTRSASGLDRLSVCRTSADERDRFAARGADLLGRLLGARRGPARQVRTTRMPVGRELARDRPSDSARAAGDDGGLRRGLLRAHDPMISARFACAASVPAGAARDAAVDPAQPSCVSISPGPTSRKDAVAVGDHALDRRVPERRAAETRREDLADALAPFRPARRPDRSTGSAARGSSAQAVDRRARSAERHGTHQLAVDRPAHRERQHVQRPRGQAPRAPRPRPRPARQDELRRRVDVADPDRAGPPARSARADLLDGLAPRAHDRAHRAADRRGARSRARRRPARRARPRRRRRRPRPSRRSCRGCSRRSPRGRSRGGRARRAASVETR